MQLDLRLDRVVALKIMHPHLAHDQAFVSRFQREARMASALNHPNICIIHDVGTQDGEAFIAMEYLAGRSLDGWIGRNGLCRSVLRICLCIGACQLCISMLPSRLMKRRPMQL